MGAACPFCSGSYCFSLQMVHPPSLTISKDRRVFGLELDMKLRRFVMTILTMQDELVRVGMSEMLIGRCLHYLQQQGDVELVRGRRMIHRIR